MACALETAPVPSRVPLSKKVTVPVSPEPVAGVTVAVNVTEWPEFAELDWAAAADAMNGRVVIDGRNFVDTKAVLASGFAYEGIGR